MGELIHAAAVSVLSEWEDLLGSGRQPEDFRRVYFGDEFCMHLIPSPDELEQAFGLAQAMGLEFTMATPYVTSKALETLRLALERLASLDHTAEVVLNDWGALHLVHREYPGFRKLLGRTLVRQKRGPRIKFMKGRIPDEGYRTFQRSHLSTDGFAAFARDYGLSRVELDNVPQGADLELEVAGLTAALHLPYVYASTTRICLIHAFTYDKFVPVDSYLRCPRPCLTRALKVDTRFRNENTKGESLTDDPVSVPESGSPFGMYCKGNSLYYENSSLPENLAQLNVDRLVHHRFLQLEDEGYSSDHIGLVRL